jgi:hypothetical protein
VFPKVTSRPPKLLQELQALVLNKQRTADKVVWPGLQLPKERDGALAANLQLDVQRQVLAAFAQGFSAYTGLVTRIQVGETPGGRIRRLFNASVPDVPGWGWGWGWQHCCVSLHNVTCVRHDCGCLHEDKQSITPTPSHTAGAV